MLLVALQMTSELPASEVVASHSALSATQQEGAESGGAASSIRRDLTQPTFQGSMVHQQLPAATVMVILLTALQGTAVFDVGSVEEGEKYHYQAPCQDLLGPGVPELEELGGYG